MAEGLYTVVLRTTSYLVSATDANAIRAAQHARSRSICFEAIRCCGDCPEGTMRVEEDVAEIRALIAHETRATITEPLNSTVIPLFR
jgi:hypothetical protein